MQIELGLLTERITPRPPLGDWRISETPDPRPLAGWRDLDAPAADVLERVLRRPGRQWGPKSLRELEGFLFAVACAPEIVQPSEWLAEVITEEDPFSDQAEATAATSALIALYGIRGLLPTFRPVPRVRSLAATSTAFPGREADEMSHSWIAVTHLDEEGYQELLDERRASQARRITDQE